MKILLTSSGIKNPSLHDALIALLGKPIAEANALFVPTGIYPFAGGPYYAWRAMSGTMGAPLCQLGWKSLGLLELTALPSIAKTVWAATVEEADALLVWGGDPVFISYWMRESGLTDMLSSRQRDLVYVGVSAGSMATASIFGETYSGPRSGRGDVVASHEIVFETRGGNMSSTLVTARGAGFVDFALIPHFNHPDHEDASSANAEKWAAKIPVPVYAIDDETAIQVTDGNVEVISEGRWKLFHA